MKSICFIICYVLCIHSYAQTLQSPSSFLGYPLGSKFTWHYNLVTYAKHVANVPSSNAIWESYGSTNEGRELGVVIISSAKNMARLNEIQEQHIQVTQGKPVTSNMPVIVWHSYNVHGDEASASEAFLQTLYTLAAKEESQVQTWLENTVVILDPCINPDGRDHYVHHITSTVGATANVNEIAREHKSPISSGRTNHYYFDLNRDWAWQTQIETIQRMALYKKWMPHIHSDYHEQHFNNPYYFAPAAEPQHEIITPWQKELQLIIGKGNAAIFDENGWLYFTKEVYDLFYPSYGDTWPLYNGSIGMTFEQGGSVEAGLAIATEANDTLTLLDRLTHHHATGLNTIKVASSNASKIITEYSNYFKAALKGSINEFKYYVVKNNNAQHIAALKNLLQKNNISFYYPERTTAEGYNYFTTKKEKCNIDSKDIVIPSAQSASNIVKVLFERESKLKDSLTYDITSWSLPYAYGLTTYGVQTLIKEQEDVAPPEIDEDVVIANPYALLIPWQGMLSAKALAQLVKQQINIRYAQKEFVYKNNTYNPGTLIITRAGNKPNAIKEAVNIIDKAIGNASLPYVIIPTGFVDKGLDLGSSAVKPIKTPKVALIAGKKVSLNAMGEIWHYFDKELQYPLAIVNHEDINAYSLQQFNTLILAEGEYDFINKTSFVKDWIKNGGKLITMGTVVSQLAKAEWGEIKIKEPKKEEEKKETDYTVLKNYDNRERDELSKINTGSVYKLFIDNTHPLAFGYPNYYYTLKLNDKMVDYLKAGWNIGYVKKDNYISGFVGNKAKPLIKDGTSIGVINEGQGSTIFFTDDILFRSFWENGKLFMANAAFF
jgi:hypothetical protein